METGEQWLDGGNGAGQLDRLGRNARTSPSPAVRGRPVGTVAWEGSDDGESLARLLGWFSVSLGVAELLAPKAVAKLVGLRPSRASSWVLRLSGLREIGHGAGILSSPRPKEWVGTRIGGDALDLALLGAAMIQSRHRERTALATAAVLGVGALDVVAFQELSESRALPAPELDGRSGSTAHRSITIGAPPEQVYAFWRNLENLPRFMKQIESVTDLGDGRSRWSARGPRGASVTWEAETIEDRPNERIAWRAVEPADVFHEGVVLFRPGREGSTVVTVEMRYAPPGGRIGAAMLRLMHREPGQLVADDLRRLKALIETGDVIESDATIGPSAPHPARPSAPEATLEITRDVTAAGRIA